jgi:hypothetical protein
MSKNVWYNFFIKITKVQDRVAETWALYCENLLTKEMYA